MSCRDGRIIGIVCDRLCKMPDRDVTLEELDDICHECPLDAFLTTTKQCKTCINEHENLFCRDMAHLKRGEICEKYQPFSLYIGKEGESL